MAGKADAATICVRDLVVGFGSQLVLRGISFEVRPGEILGIVGASGGGKSVLLRTIIGLLHKRCGKISVFGVDIDLASPEEMRSVRRRWGVLFQQGALFSSLNASENVEFPIREHLKLPMAMYDEIAAVKLEMVGIDAKDACKLPAELSGGMVKRVAFARALALDPEIVFLDEPTSGLDPISAGEFDTLIRTLQRTLGLTVFMVTHDLDCLYKVCDRIIALADGEIVAEGPIGAMLASEHPWVKAYFRGGRGRAATDIST
jgi:phospholipid/cholesterol/gamma-HCH transport system ATP-binding protein